MERNVGHLDAGIRWALAAVFFAVSLAFAGGTAVTFLAAALAVVMVATALTRTCPLYRLFGLSTCPRNTVGRAG